MEFGPFVVPAPPSLETGLASTLLGCFHVPRCAHSLKHTKSIVLMWSITGSVRMMVITRTLERGGMTVGLFGMGPECFCRRAGCV